MSAEIAQQLKQAREARGESLTEACERSGISLAILQGLEAARFDTVEPIYMRMGVRSYSEYLGLDTAALLSMFDRDVAARLPDVPEPPPVPRPQAPKGGKGSTMSGRRMVTVAALLLAAAALVWILVTQFSDDGEPIDTESVQPGSVPSSNSAGRVGSFVETTTPASAARDVLPQLDREAEENGLEAADSKPDESLREVASTTTAIESAEPIASDQSELETADATPPDEVSPSLSSVASVEQTGSLEADADSLDESALVLEVEAIDSTWVQISWDGGVAFQGILPPGLKRRWVAHESFLVRSGRAHGARYWLQGNLLGNGRLGEATKVLRFRADSEGIALLGPELEPLSLTPLTSITAER
jgi:cytoskeletal protein RodZ